MKPLLRESTVFEKGYPYGSVLASPWLRLMEAGDMGKVAAGLAAVAQVVLGDLFTGIAVLLVLSGAADLYDGMRVARHLGTYDPLKAEIGFHTKLMGVVLCLLIRGFEWWWAGAVQGLEVNGVVLDGLHTYGMLAASSAAILFVRDLKSIREKRERMGVKLPVIGAVLDVMDVAARRLFGPSQADFTRREEDERKGEDS